MPVWVSVAQIEASWKENKEDYVGPGGTVAAIDGRYEKLDKWMSRGEFATAHMSQVCLDESGMVQFSDGRHRFAWVRDHAAEAIQVQVPPNQGKAFAHRFGTDARLSDYLPPLS
ncbi:MAG: hypothetical protein Q8K23_21950 [Sulfuritalea sp.]|nr:hypothetical protein [Sulfuritalea sp.]